MTFVDELLLFPTAFFTGALGLSVLYWLFVIIGAVGIDVIDLDGVVEGLDSLEGAMDGAIDGAMDGAIDGAMDGAADGAMDAGADGVADSIGGGHSLTWYFVHALALQKAPATVVLSLFVLFAWTISALAMHYFVAGAEGDTGLLSAAVLFGSLVGATAVTNRAVQPLERFFEDKQAARRTDSIGRNCEIRTGRVDATFGQAESNDGGAGLVIEVRCEEPNTLRKGDNALIISFDDKREVYWVEPMQGLLDRDGDVPTISARKKTDGAERNAAVLEEAEVEQPREEEVEA